MARINLPVGLASIIAALLLAALVSALPSKPLDLEAAGDPKGAKWPTDESGWPKLAGFASYNEINTTRMDEAVMCLMNWCQEDLKLLKNGGKVRCITDHDQGTNYVAWVCNASQYEKVCSKTAVKRAYDTLYDQAQEQGGDPEHSGGMLWYSTNHHDHLLFGFDRVCTYNRSWSHNCGKQYHTETHCDQVLELHKSGLKGRNEFVTGNVWVNGNRKNMGFATGKVQGTRFVKAFNSTGHTGSVWADEDQNSK
ncbi:hypothetical protein QBC43DRAFT_336927 [Cladorrhinum sp. PSN259]|nr:hypothetical protein QBC43DRAFT_336927 [Cladorrhinum sp. PSN259]